MNEEIFPKKKDISKKVYIFAVREHKTRLKGIIPSTPMVFYGYWQKNNWPQKPQLLT